MIPTYQSFVMIAWIGVGLFVFGEYQMYETEKLIGIAASVCMTLLGVKFLTMKKRGSSEENTNPQEASQSAKLD